MALRPSLTQYFPSRSIREVNYSGHQEISVLPVQEANLEEAIRIRDHPTAVSIIVITSQAGCSLDPISAQ